MRHGKSGRKLKRTASHRRATLASLCTALLRHKRITTTVAKAKEARMVAEKIITRARKAVAHEKDAPAAAIHARRQVGRLIRDREVVRELFGAITDKVGTRPGGYTRVVRLGQRYGDGAEMAVLELVDFNTGQEKAEKTPAPTKRKKTATGGRTTKAVEKKKGAAKTARKPKTEKPSDKSGPSTAAQPEKS